MIKLMETKTLEKTLADSSLFNLEQRKLKPRLFTFFKNIQCRERLTVKYEVKKQNIKYDYGYIRIKINVNKKHEDKTMMKAMATLMRLGITCVCLALPLVLL